MLDGCNDVNEDLKATIIRAAEDAYRFGSSRIGTEHLLLSLASEQNTIASAALDSMKIDALSVQQEIEKLGKQKEYINSELPHNEVPGNIALTRLCFKNRSSKHLPFSDQAIRSLAKSDDFSHYLGQEEIGGAHLLLALLENKETCAARILEELSINIVFLKGKILHSIAAACLKMGKTASLRTVLATGLKQLVEKHNSALYMVYDLEQKSKMKIIDSPKKEDILHSVCIAYLAECLYNQVALQRYLLEESLNALCLTVGNLSEEIASQIVSMTAQHLRKHTRQGIEYIWTDEYRSIQHMLSDAEHDLIGSVVEDLWWAYSEDVALDKSFASALADHRKTHLLELQERRVELSQRLRRIRSRLEDTIRQCFKNRITKV